jgi:hypothetical protein
MSFVDDDDVRSPLVFRKRDPIPFSVDSNRDSNREIDPWEAKSDPRSQNGGIRLLQESEQEEFLCVESKNHLRFQERIARFLP